MTTLAKSIRKCKKKLTSIDVQSVRTDLVLVL